ncbi:Cytochrome P450 18a1 [Eumeta japonica]|uniref:Cytochrome P450 18a1 n=1 Tax=Eumeta variegata TaxID=151549 RepID=A0A4C2A8A3_EUMVA|nr:Cytochrome P450 18a1 [Eumeta japonica]
MELHDYMSGATFTAACAFRQGFDPFLWSQNEINELITNLRSTEGGAIDANPLLALGVSNVICGITMSYLPGKAQAQVKVMKNRAEMFEFYQTLIDEHRATLDVVKARDPIDVYPIEIERAKVEGRAENFRGKGSRNPDVKQRVQEELDSVIGRDRLPTIEDMPNLPYTETTILETLRMSSIVPLATTHSPKCWRAWRLFLVHNAPVRRARGGAAPPSLRGTVGATIAPQAFRVVRATVADGGAGGAAVALAALAPPPAADALHVRNVAPTSGLPPHSRRPPVSERIDHELILFTFSLSDDVRRGCA